MTLLYYFWGENSEHDIEQTFLSLGHQVLKFTYPFKNYENDPVFMEQMHTLLSQHAIDFVFSFNYFPLLSKICEEEQLLYVSWIYDCPHFSLYSPSVCNDCNRIFVFDKEQYLQLQANQVKHVYHLPLAGNTTRLASYLPIQFPCQDFMHDVSFVGSFYEHHLFSSVSYLPEYMKGFIDGILSAQSKLWGIDLIPTLLTESVLDKLKPYMNYQATDGYSITFRDFCSFMLQQKLTYDERVMYLNYISKQIPIDIYSGSDTHALCPNATPHPFISYYETMPRVFYQSKINLNLSLRSITSGIPLRCIDILSSGGFLLSNYQKELAEFFRPDYDFVYFEDEKDLLDKIRFYLSHDDARNQIAAHGFEMVKENYSYEIQIKKMLSLL